MSAVLVTIVKTKGSTPRNAGARMIVTAHEIWQTIGGGALEFDVMATARAMLAKAEVMSAATGHLGGGAVGATPAPAPRRRAPAQTKPDESDELIRAAMEEMQRGDQLTAIETATRRPASMRLMGSGANGGISMRGGRGGRGRGSPRGRGRGLRDSR